MIRRSIAALIVAIFCCLNAPVAFASPLMSAIHVAESDANAPHEHGCCPQPDHRLAPALFLTSYFPTMPCGGQHPCCARGIPSSPTTLPVETKVVKPGAQQTFVRLAGEIFPTQFRRAETFAIGLLALPIERRTVLRN